MKLLQGDWLEIAKNIPQGGNRRMACSESCGQDNSQLVSHSHKGYNRYCFRCQAHQFVPHGQLRIADIERHKRERAIMDARVPTLPDDYTLDVPVRKMFWYLQYGIDADLAREYRIGYSEKLDRIVLPVYEEEELTALQMRAVDKWIKPKYLNPHGPKVSSAVFQSHTDNNGITVVVEDILSAIKVGKVAHTTSILGTNMTDARAMKIAKQNHTAILWLDNDKAGHNGRVDAVRQLQMQGLEVYTVQSERDPKKYNTDEIKLYLRGMKKND